MTTKTKQQPVDDLSAIPKNARKRRKQKILLTASIISAAVVILLIVGILTLRNKVTEQYGSGSSADVETASVTTGSISTTVSGSGTLADEGVEEVSILNSLQVDEIRIEAGDSVTQGDVIATVTNASLVSAMAELQNQLDELDAQLEDASDDEVSSSISSGVTGRVKWIYAEAGDDVATVMYDNGALMLLSLDGYMALDLSLDAISLSAGDSVTVTLSDGTEKTGTVEKISDSTATILITDNGPEYGNTVTVTDSDGNELGTATLYIHSQLEITGYAGTVYAVKVSENTKVYSGTTLMTLTDTSYTAGYETILQERADLEEQLEGLITIYKEGGISAPISGVVASVDYSDSSTATTAGTMDSTDTGTSYITVATISPNESMSITVSVDESDILSLSVGQEASVTIDSIGEDAYTGTVTEISTTATSSSGVTAYSAVITIDKTEDMLSGMSASVVITIEGVENALLIPVDALHQTSSTAYVYTAYDEASGELSGMTEVTIGLSNSTYVEITSGLSEGDTVYYTVTEDASTNFGGMNMPGGSGFDGSGFVMPSGGDFSGGSGMSGGGMAPGN